jgi:O-antigen/teichoic acid export membrane protein
MDQVMIGEMIGDTEVGYYTAALRISSIWYFIPMMIANSLFPAIIATKKREEAQYMQRIEKLYALMGWMGITVAIVITLSAAWLINLLFGEGYVASANILTIHIWTGIAISMGFVHSKWLVIESFQKYLIIYTSIAAFINIVGNMILIPSYGASGAAVATLLAQFSPIFLQLFIHDVRRNFYLMLASFLFPIKRVLSVI